MSLTSDAELASDRIFQSKVRVALSRAALEQIDEKNPPEQIAFAKQVLHDLPRYGEIITATVAGSEGVDTSATDDAILKAVRKILKVMS